MAKKFDDVIAALPVERRAKIERRAQELVARKDSRQAVEKIHADPAKKSKKPRFR